MTQDCQTNSDAAVVLKGEIIMLKTALSVGLLSTCTVLLSCVNNFANALTFQTYSDRASWLAAIGGTTTTENFNSFTADTPFGGSSITAGSLLLRSNGNASLDALIDIPSYRSLATGIDGTPLLNLNGLTPNENVTIQLPDLSSAFGFDFENYDINGDAASIIISGQTVGNITPTRFAKGFFGVVATDGLFNQVKFNASPSGLGSGTFNAIDNIEYAAAAPVPEPSALLGLVVFGVGATLRRRKERSLKC